MCPLCNSPVQFIGTLGTLAHFKCVNCGIESSMDAPNWEPTCEISNDECHGDTHQPGVDLWFCDHHNAWV